MKLRGGTRFALAVIVILTAAYGVNWLVSEIVPPKHLATIPPSETAILGMKLRGEKIIVMNGIAHLVYGAGSEYGVDPTKDLDTATGRKIPLKALVGTLRGEEAGATELVEALSKIERENIPPEEIIWNKADIEKALAGEPQVRAKLERQLNTTLEGKPTPLIIPNYLHSGIYIRLPVPVMIPSSYGGHTVIAYPLLAYRTQLASRTVNHRIIVEKAFPTHADWEGAYEDAWKQLQKEGSPENVAESLRSLISDARARALAKPVEDLLSRVTVLLTEEHIMGAGKKRIRNPEGKGFWYTITLNLNEEGRMRLWRYTHENPGCQLLFVVNGVAIAAPFVKQEMKYSTAEITNITDEDLVDEALRALHQGMESKTL
ncbi:MAG: hypothetical protein K6T17_08805 [Fimbriimonadales bacterium]|nr:hypothetical protein [Fimbriimonadales bacterium]